MQGQLLADDDCACCLVEAIAKMCLALPEVIGEVVAEAGEAAFPQDTAAAEFRKIAGDNGGSYALALYMLGFGSYKGFCQ